MVRVFKEKREYNGMTMIERHEEKGIRAFLKRTVAAQTHMLGMVAAIVGLIVLIRMTSERFSWEHVAACLAFGVTGILVFATSSIYHFIGDGFKPSEKLTLLLEDLDHFAIYLFIAGTYTPFLLNTVAPPWRGLLLVMVWILALIGIFYTRFKSRLPLWAQHRFIYTGVFMLMGWTLLIRVGEIVNRLSEVGLWLLVAGGLSYSVGAVVYATKRPKLFGKVFGFHELWHVLVLVGFCFHFFLIMGFYNS